jgi:hypothetical protein
MTAYEIRLKLLEMAQGLLIEKFHQDYEIERMNWEKSVSDAEKNNTTVSIFQRKTSFPTEEDIINKAKTLKDFVSSKE